MGLSNDFAAVQDMLLKRAAAEQGGVISGDNPAHYNAQNPIRLWVIQLVIIIGFTQLLALILGRIRQPRVIAEVIAGIILGPSVMGRIPRFQNSIFPQDSMPLLNVTANIGLILFLFIIGMEIDTRVIKNNVRASASISLAGLVVPLGLGAALGVGVYREFVSPTVNFGYFILFVAVAVGITAFPVLCRILTELKLLDTTVGVVTLSAGVGNDVIGWILLALSVALVNASNGLTALYVLLASAGFILFLLYPVRWAFVWLAKITGSLEQGTPTTTMMTVTLLTVFISAFFTDIIGVHAIFGGFLAGLIVPHNNGFAISLVEKIEDLVSILLLPIYFTLSGLRTNLGLLDEGRTWGYIILICVVAFVSKFLPCAAAARLCGFNIRESGAIGSLMSCKGLVELIVLNVGFQAGILDSRTFSMFVVHAVVLTFITTPLVLMFYPERVRVHQGSAHDAIKAPAGDADAERSTDKNLATSEEDAKTRFALVLDKLEQLPAAMTLTQLLNPFAGSSARGAPLSESISVVSADSEDRKGDDTSQIPTLIKEKSRSEPPKAPGFIDLTLLRLIELSNRTSAVLKSQEAAALVHSDPVVSVFSTFAWLAGVTSRLCSSAPKSKGSTLNTALEVVPWDEFDGVVGRHVEERKVEMLLIPWASTGNGATAAVLDQNTDAPAARNPFDGVFHRPGASAAGSPAASSQHDQLSSVVYAEFIRKLFLNTPCDVTLFVDRGRERLGLEPAITSAPSALNSIGGNADTLLFLPFYGGPDDRLALKLVVQICSRNPCARAVVVRVVRASDEDSSESDDEKKEKVPPPYNTISAADTVYGQQNTQTRLASDTADNLLWDRLSTSGSSRITFVVKKTSRPLRDIVDLVSPIPTTDTSPAMKALNAAVKPGSGVNTVVVCGRSRRMAAESLGSELSQIVSTAPIATQVSRTLGDVGAAMVAVGARASLMVCQARINE
ncbi:hydrogen antiporter [Moniliophthora roreri]|uniref:Cation/H+ exchanger transmembrane domain-containing protein n=1 Tax=Moniliophthora roreri TaxID=221103 RepID=A0A0W0FV59_MONRR|nr:hydrogen antiporter [Moniliophthora roreri]